MRRYPPGGEVRLWTSGKQTPWETFVAAAPDIFVRGSKSIGLKAAATRPKSLMRNGFRLVGRAGGDVTIRFDAPKRLLPDLWQIDRPGPGVEIWARAEVAETVRELLPPDLWAPLPATASAPDPLPGAPAQAVPGAEGASDR
jgi:hypothetical protein